MRGRKASLFFFFFFFKEETSGETRDRWGRLKVNESRGLAMHYAIDESALFSLWRIQHDLESIVSEKSKTIRAVSELWRPEACPFFI